MNKRVCFFNSTKVWGGGEKWHHEMALRLHDLGWHVVVITNPHSALYQRLAQTAVILRPIRISNVSFLNPFTILEIYRIFKHEAIESVLFNLSSDLKAGGIAAKLAGIPQIVYRRGLARPIQNTWLNRLLFQQVLTDVIVNSQEMARNVLQQNAGLIAPQHMHLIYNGIDLAVYDAEPATPVYVKHPGEIVLGNVGRLVEQKGQMYLIELVARLKAQGMQVKLLVAGTGKLEAQLKQAARAHDVADEVVFLGFVEHIKAVMESIDIFVLSSLYEGFGYVLTEAMASCKPVVAFNVSSNPEIVMDGQTGFLVPTGDVEALTQRVTALIRQPQQRQELGRNARARVEAMFTFERAVQQVLALLEGRDVNPHG